MSNFDHVVTQWMAPLYVDDGRAWSSSHVQVVGFSTRPSTLNVHEDVSSRGVASAVSTGHWLPMSYWPGGSRGSRSARPRPMNPRVNRDIPMSVRAVRSDPVGSLPFDRRQTELQLVDTVAQQGDLRLETDLALSPALDPGRTGGPGHDGVEGPEGLRAVRTVDEPGRDLPVAVPGAQGGARHAGLGLGLTEGHPGRVLELGEQRQLGLPASQPLIPVQRHRGPPSLWR